MQSSRPRPSDIPFFLFNSKSETFVYLSGEGLLMFLWLSLIEYLVVNSDFEPYPNDAALLLNEVGFE